MRLWAAIAAGAAIGAVVGALHFGLLWLTVRRIPRERHPARMMAAGAFARFALFIGGFVLAARHAGAAGVIAALAALLAVRTLMIRRARVGAAPFDGGTEDT